MTTLLRRLLVRVVLVALVVVGALLLLRDSQKPAAPVAGLGGIPAAAQPAVVESVVDGDTIWVGVDEDGGPLAAGASHKIRLLEIDTPETVDPSRGVQCGGPEATAFAQKHLRVGSRVYLLADREDTDQYGRFLRYVWTDDGKFFNLLAVQQGVARAVLYEPNDAYIDVLRAAEAEARAAKLGLWGACG